MREAHAAAAGVIFLNLVVWLVKFAALAAVSPRQGSGFLEFEGPGLVNPKGLDLTNSRVNQEFADSEP